MKIKVEIGDEELKGMLIAALERKVNTAVNKDDVKIQVMSKQNYRVQEWESGHIRATIEIDTNDPLR